MSYLNEKYLEDCKKTCYDYYFDKYVAEDTAFNLAMKFKKLDKVLSSYELDALVSAAIITIDYNYTYDLITADGSNSEGTYAIDKRGFYELKMYTNAPPDYIEVDLKVIANFLEQIEAYTFEYLPELGIFNIKTVAHIKSMIEKYPKQVFDIIEFGDNTITTCEDFLTQFRIFWLICKSQYYGTLSRTRKYYIKKGMVPIARYSGASASLIAPMVEECISKTVLYEHFKRDKQFRSDTTNSNEGGDGATDIIHWVSFKSVINFLETTTHKPIHPPEVLEILLANFGLVKSNLCKENEREYEKYIDQFGLVKYNRINKPEEAPIQYSIDNDIDNDGSDVEELSDLSSLEGLFD